GICLRLWDEPQTTSLEPYAQPEILAADLSSFVLDLAQWGALDPATLTFLDPPPQPALAEARALLRDLGAVEPDGRITPLGRQLRRLPLPPRLARMMVDMAARGAARQAADVALIVTERGLGGDDVDLAHRLDALRRDRSPRAADARRMAGRWANIATFDLSGRLRASVDTPSPGMMLALAFPDRIARIRGAETGSFLLANGRGSSVALIGPLSREPFLAVAELAGRAAQSRILLAAAITADEIEQMFGDRIETKDEIAFDDASASLRGRRSRRLGAIVLADRNVRIEPN